MGNACKCDARKENDGTDIILSTKENLVAVPPDEKNQFMKEGEKGNGKGDMSMSEVSSS